MHSFPYCLFFLSSKIALTGACLCSCHVSYYKKRWSSKQVWLNYVYVEGESTYSEVENNMLKFDLSSRQTIHVLPYTELDMTGYGGMKILCHCFGLFYEDHSSPRGLHRGLLRWDEGDRLLIKRHYINQTLIFFILIFRIIKD